VKRSRHVRGLTLVELIVVMAMLATVMAISTPVLSRFFRGRTLEEEARRFLALTRYARSEAISRSVLMELWINPEMGVYGLSPQSGYELDDRKRIEFRLADGLSFEVDRKILDERGETKIGFWPDGSIDEESLIELRIQQDDDGETIEIVQADFGMGYFIHEPEEGELGV
jgi:prepilin-type N-terminal cleavage/methylation domain-containing protein